jgi:arylsulfatase A-like enzyme
MRWPGVLPANKTSTQAAITMDLTATILAVTGTAIPANHPLDGINLLPILSGRSPIIERRLFWRRLRPTEQRAVRSGGWKLLKDGVNFYLFDVAADPGERHDLTAQHPELVRKLSAEIDKWEQDVGVVRQTP